MKKSYVIRVLTVLAILLTVLVAPRVIEAVSGNLVLVNPSFESDNFNGWSTPIGWSLNRSGGNHFASCGSGSIPPQPLKTQPYAATPGHVYLFSIDVKMQNANDSITLQPVWTLSSGSTYAEPTVTVNVNDNQWHTYTVNEIAPVHATYFQLQVSCTASSVESVDNASVIDYSPDDLGDENQDLNDAPPSAQSSEGYTTNETDTAWLDTQNVTRPKIIVRLFNDENNDGEKASSESWAGAGITVQVEKCPTTQNPCADWTNATVFTGTTSSNGRTSFNVKKNRQHRITVIPDYGHACNTLGCVKKVYIKETSRRLNRGIINIAGLHEDSESAVTYSGTGWQSVSNSRASGGSYHAASNSSNTACLTFGGGTRVGVGFITGSDQGKMQILLDNVQVNGSPFDNYSSYSYSGDLTTTFHVFKWVRAFA